MADTIYVVDWDSAWQYGGDGERIAEWDDKACGWFVLPRYEGSELVYKEDENGATDIPRARRRGDCEEVRTCPNIELDVSYVENGTRRHCVKTWGYLNFTEAEAIECLGKCYLETVGAGFNEMTLSMTYNGKPIWNASKADRTI